MIVSAATLADQVGSDIDGEAEDDGGDSVSLSADGTIVAIGAGSNDGNGVDAGHVRVYEWDGSAWVQKGGDIDGEAAGDASGRSVSLSADGTEVAIGAIGHESYSDETGTMMSFAGHVRIYEWNGSAWVQKGSDIDGDAQDDRLGLSVSLSADGTRVAMGAPYNDGTASNAGHVRIYEWNDSAWVQKGVDIGGEAADDNSGWSVALSADGTRVAVGGYFNDETGSNAGHVRVYEWDGSAWVQKGSDIDGEGAGDQSGTSVALSADGTEVAIGAPGHESYTGYVRVLEWDGSAWVQKYSDLDGDGQYASAGSSVSLSTDGNKVAFIAGYGKVRIYSGPLNITYDSQGGTAVSDGDAATTFGGAIGTLPTAPTRDGYTFVGWFTSASGGSEITTSAAHNQTADFTLYAQWTANPTTTTTVAPTTTTTVAPVAVELPATGLSGGTVAQVLLVLGIGGLVMLVTRRRLNS